MPLYLIPWLNFIAYLIFQFISNSFLFSIWPDYIICPRIFFSLLYQLPHCFKIAGSDCFSDSDYPCNLKMNSNLVYLNVRVSRDNASGRIIYSLSSEIMPDSSFLAFDSFSYSF